MSKSSESLTQSELSDIEYAIEAYKSVHESSDWLCIHLIKKLMKM